MPGRRQSIHSNNFLKVSSHGAYFDIRQRFDLVYRPAFHSPLGTTAYAGSTTNAKQ
jgi:hypothetical protein